MDEHSERGIRGVGWPRCAGHRRQCSATRRAGTRPVARQRISLRRQFRRCSRGGDVSDRRPAGDSFQFRRHRGLRQRESWRGPERDNIAAAGTQFIQTVGDNVYPSSGLPDPDFGTAYSDFDSRLYDPFREPLQSQAFFPANGNQEYYSDGAFWQNLPMPGENHSWYSYDWGDAHVLVLDTERPFGPGSDQYAFARADLAASQDRAWRIVAMQRPPYSSTSEYSSSVAAQRDLVPLFQIGRVGLVLSGNSHNYERTVPLINGTPASRGGITYVVTGGGGNSFNNFTTPQPPRTAFRQDGYYEFVKVTVSPTSLAVEAVAADTNTVFDSTTIGLDKSDTVPPGGPTSLSAATVTASSVSLAWHAANDDVAVVAYEIYRDRVTFRSGHRPPQTSSIPAWCPEPVTSTRLWPSTRQATDQRPASRRPSPQRQLTIPMTVRNQPSPRVHPMGRRAAISRAASVPTRTPRAGPAVRQGVEPTPVSPHALARHWHCSFSPSCRSSSGGVCGRHARNPPGFRRLTGRRCTTAIHTRVHRSGRPSIISGSRRAGDRPARFLHGRYSNGRPLRFRLRSNHRGASRVDALREHRRRDRVVVGTGSEV